MTSESASKKNYDFRVTCLTCWASLGLSFGIILIFFASGDDSPQKGDHVICDDSCMFSPDFQAPQGSENDAFKKKCVMRHANLRTTFGTTKCRFPDHFGKSFDPENNPK